MAQSPLPGGPNIIQTPLMDKSGHLDGVWQRWFLDVIQRIQKGLNQAGELRGKIAGRTEDITTTVQHLDANGVVDSTGMVAATDAAQGAVKLPTGATSNTLGTAAMQAASGFDAAGSAATAQSNAQAYAANASNLSSGTVSAARLPAISTISGQITTGQLPTVGVSGTVTLAKLTPITGSDGSLTLTNGIITGYSSPT